MVSQTCLGLPEMHLISYKYIKIIYASEQEIKYVTFLNLMIVLII
jgi:hypothetical protein